MFYRYLTFFIRDNVMFIGFCKYTTVHVERLREVEIGPCRHESHYDDPQTSIYFCEGGVGGSMSVYVDV